LLSQMCFGLLRLHVMTTVTNVHPNSTLGVWAYHSYNEQNRTFSGYWYVGHLEGDGYKL
jgi:hypothetical protein